MFRRIFNRHCAFRDENRGKGIFSFKFIVTSSVLLRKKKRKRYRAERRWSNKAGKDNSVVGLPKTATEAFKEFFFFSLRVSHGYLSCKLREQSNSKVVELQSKKNLNNFLLLFSDRNYTISYQLIKD